MRFFRGRHALVPFPRPEDLPAVADVCRSFVLDNGAFTVWKSGGTLDVPGYVGFVREWCQHPAFDWALIPDVIEGDETDNDRMISDWPTDLIRHGVPVWHYHESTDRLRRLCDEWPTVALGSSGQWPMPGNESWWERTDEAMRAACDGAGRPLAKLHGLRMLSRDIFERLPLRSADSTNVAQNHGGERVYRAPSEIQRAELIAGNIELATAATTWRFQPQQLSLSIGD